MAHCSRTVRGAGAAAQGGKGRGGRGGRVGGVLGAHDGAVEAGRREGQLNVGAVELEGRPYAQQATTKSALISQRGKRRHTACWKMQQRGPTCSLHGNMASRKYQLDGVEKFSSAQGASAMHQVQTMGRKQQR